jgi:hypothetical protein
VSDHIRTIDLRRPDRPDRLSSPSATFPACRELLRSAAGASSLT